MNVVHIGDRDGAQAGLRRSAKLLNTARDIMAERLSLCVKTMLDKVDDTLFDFAEKCENNTLQSLYFDAMREVRVKRARIETEFKGRVLDAMNARMGAAQQAAGDFGAVKLALVEDDAMEEDIAVANMAEKLTNCCRDELFALDNRIGALLGDPGLERHDNPLGPRPICEAIRGAIASLEAGIKVRLVILKLFDRYVANEVLLIYQEINQFFVRHGVLPDIRAGVRRNPVGPGITLQSPTQASVATAGAAVGDSGGAVTLLSTLQQLLGLPATPVAGATGGLSAPAAIVDPGAAAAAGVAALGAHEIRGVVETLTSIQQGAASRALRFGGGAPGGSGNIVRELKTSGVLPRLDAQGDMTIDIVAMLFDYILADRNLPDAVRVLIGRLQIPIVKVALIDRDFFARKAHPARRLLNAMAEVGAEWACDPVLSPQLQARLEQIVDRVTSEFNDDVGIFTDIVAELEAFIEEARRQAVVREDRTHKVVQGRDRLEQAKVFARQEIERRLAAPDVPETVRSFLLSHWQRLLLTTAAQEGENSSAVRNAIATMDDLIWSVTPKSGAEDRRRLAIILPQLLKRLRAGMEVVSTPHVVRTGFLTKLAKCHAQLVRNATAPAATPETPAPAPAAGAASAQPGAVLDDPVHERTEPPVLEVAAAARAREYERTEPPVPQARTGDPAGAAADVPVDALIDTVPLAAAPLADAAPPAHPLAPPLLDLDLDLDLTAELAAAPVTAAVTCAIDLTVEADPAPVAEAVTCVPAVAPIDTAALTAPPATAGTSVGSAPPAAALPDIDIDDPLETTVPLGVVTRDYGAGALADGFDSDSTLPEIDLPPPADDVQAAAPVSLAAALRERLLYDSGVSVQDLVAQQAETATVSAASTPTHEGFARLLEAGDFEVEEVTLVDEGAAPAAPAPAPADAEDEHTKLVAGLKRGAWLEFTSADNDQVRARLSWINSATDVFMFTDRNGHKFADRTRNGLVAEFRRGTARIVEETPLLDRAFTRLLDGLAGAARPA